MRLVPVLAACVAISCLPPSTVDDPRALGEDHDRWEAVMSAERARVFSTALHVLADSGYTARHADPAVGIIGTNLRRINVAGNTGDYRLDFMVLQAGDSTRLVIRGEWCHNDDGAQQCYKRRADEKDWRVVRNIGEAILERTSR